LAHLRSGGARAAHMRLREDIRRLPFICAAVCLAALADAVFVGRTPEVEGHHAAGRETKRVAAVATGKATPLRSPAATAASAELRAALAQLGARGSPHRAAAVRAIRHKLALIAEEPDVAAAAAVSESIEEEAKRVVADAEAQAGGIEEPPAEPLAATALGGGAVDIDADDDDDDVASAGEVGVADGLAAAPSAAPPAKPEEAVPPPAGLAEGKDKDGDGKGKDDATKDKDKDKDVDEEEVKREVDAELAKEDAFEKGEEAEREAKAVPSDAVKKDDVEKALDEKWDKTKSLQKEIADQTHSKALSEMLTRVRMDTYMIRQKIDILEREISDGVTLEEADPADKLVFPLSVCMQCILMLTVQYFIVYTVLAASKVFIDCFSLGECTTLEMALQGACDTVFYAPMLCVLFLGAQLRASQISQGRKDPPEIAEIAMQVCCWSVLVQTLLVLSIPLFTGKAAMVGEEGIVMPTTDDRAMAGLLSLIRYTAMAGLYVGFTIVCIVAMLMDARMLEVHPVDIWDDPTTAETEYAPHLSVAMRCTIVLTQLFFLLYLLHAVLSSIVQFVGNAGLPDTIHRPPRSFARRWVLKWERCLKACTQSVSVAPMVCTLLMAARMRALELNPKDGKPEWWAEKLFYVVVGAIIVQVVLVFLSAGAGMESKVIFFNGAIARGSPNDDGKDLEELACAEASGLELMVMMLQSLVLFVAYGAVLGVVWSILVARDVAEGAPPAPITPTMLCVLILSAMYFFIHIGLFLASAVAACIFSFATTVTHERVESVLRMVHLFKLAEYTVKLCPMMAVLCLGVRERALNLSAYQGSPQCWAQDAMYVATFALLLQLLLVLIGGTFSPGVGVDESGSPVTRGMKYVPGMVALEAAKALAFVALYGGLALVAVSVLVIRPETAGCEARGFRPLVF